MRTKRKCASKGTRKRKGGGIFDWFNKKKDTPKDKPKDDKQSVISIVQSKDSIIYLDPIQSTNVWSCVLLPPYNTDSADNICTRIQELSIKLKDPRGPLTSCNFNKLVQDRINTITNNANNYKKNSGNFNMLENDFIEMQLYILVCRTQFTNRGITLDLLGKVGSTIF
jgi:hypothetical protein